jgi:hypothetical protein
MREERRGGSGEALETGLFGFYQPLSLVRHTFSPTRPFCGPAEEPVKVGSALGAQRYRDSLFLWAFSRQGATGVPLFTTWDSVAGSGRAPIPGNISGRS